MLGGIRSMEEEASNDVVETKQVLGDDQFEDAQDEIPTPRSSAVHDHGDRSALYSSVASCSSEISVKASPMPPTLRRRLISGRGRGNRERSSFRSQPSVGPEDLGNIYNRCSREDEVISGEVEPMGSPQVASSGFVAGVGLGELETEVNGNQNPESSDEIGSGWLEDIAEFLLKAIVFQITVLFNVMLSPFWIVYKLYMLAVDPLGFLWRLRESLQRKLSSVWKWGIKRSSPAMQNWLKEHEININAILQLGRGLLWSIYVGTVLSGLLIFSLIGSRLMVQLMVERPLEIQKNLNFDYTDSRPVAYVPVMACKGVHCPTYCNAKDGEDAHRFHAPLYLSRRSQKISIDLTLPESEYNRKLGIFMVRVDFLSEKSEVLHTIIQRGMLKFKSQPVRLLSTMLKIVPIVAGYVSESQKLVFKARNFRVEKGQVSCLRVTLEQRAELLPNAGIPEIYHASLSLSSELPCVKKVLWNWRKTVFVWIAILLFVVQLLFALVCCRIVVIPSSRTATSVSQTRN